MSFFLNSPLAAQDDRFLKVIIGSDQTIRDVADQYLSDPDLWPEILRSSGIESIADLKPGMELLIPVTEVSAANQALLESLGQIQKANLAGAQLFAPENISRAVDLHEQALTKRLASEWIETKDLATASYGEATTAIEKSEAQRDQHGEALVSDRTGAVEGQRPEDLSWRDLQLRAILVEEEKVRTLSDSTAQITFRDASRLRLNSNSNAIIKEMRYDPLRKTEEAKVSLVEGDFYAVLSDDSDRSRFNVEIPQVAATIDSGDFWVSNDEDSAKFANYDDAPVQVAANGEMVELGKNQGTIVGKGNKPQAAIAVLPAPSLLSPADGGPVYVVDPELTWSPVEGSAGYWLEIAGDQGFDRIIANEFGIAEPHHVAAALPVGEYFWRVSALDGFGIPGARSPTYSFTIAPDGTPPYLTIEKPASDGIVREASLEVSGESEPDVGAVLGETQLTIGPDGKFSQIVQLAEGENLITVIAVDPAGNYTTRERRITYMPDRSSVVAFDQTVRQVAPLHFITNGNVISLSGRTTANSSIEIKAGETVTASGTSDAEGVFRINVPLGADEQAFAFTVIAPSGFTSAEDFAVTIDRQPPPIALETLPRLTAEQRLRIAGKTDADATLTLNGHQVSLADGRFEVAVTLAVGPNVIELIATDPVGNVTVEKSTVKLDQEPPNLVRSAAGPASNGSKQVLSVEVFAEDASGLAKAAPITVIANGASYTGFLRYNKVAKSYQGIVVIPESDLATARLSQVELRDDAGNSRTFSIQ